MCIYDTHRYLCTGEEISLVQRCPWPTQCIPHIRLVLYRTAVCRLCAVAGLEAGAFITYGRREDGAAGISVDNARSDRPIEPGRR